MPVSAAFSVVLSRGQQLLHLGNNICHRDSPARRASKAAVLCASDQGKGRKDRHQQNMLCEGPLTSPGPGRPRAGSCDGLGSAHHSIRACGLGY